jgi:histone H1/5
MSSMRSVRSSTRYPKRDRTPAAQPAPPAPKATSRKRKAAASSGSSQKKARKGATGATTSPNSITSNYQRLVFEAVASCKKGASYTSIHNNVSSAKPDANRKLVTKAVAALVGSGLIEPTKRHQRTFKTSAKADKAVSAQNKAAKKKAKKETKKAAPAKAKAKKTKTATKKKAAPKKTKKKAAPKKKAAAKKKAAPKKTKKKAVSKGPKLTGYQQLVLDAVASAPRGGASHTQIHAAVKEQKEKANKTYITKAVRAVVDLGMIVSTKLHARKFILKK